MEHERFEKLITEAVLAVPKRIREAMNNVAFVVEDYARSAQGNEYPVTKGMVLLGLYQGIPLTRHGAGYSGVLPDKITLSKNIIEELSGNDATRTAVLVRETVHHEIAHHLGFTEAEVRKWEAKRHGKHGC